MHLCSGGTNVTEFAEMRALHSRQTTENKSIPRLLILIILISIICCLRPFYTAQKSFNHSYDRSPEKSLIDVGQKLPCRLSQIATQIRIVHGALLSNAFSGDAILATLLSCDVTERLAPVTDDTKNVILKSNSQHRRLAPAGSPRRSNHVPPTTNSAFITEPSWGGISSDTFNQHMIRRREQTRTEEEIRAGALERVRGSSTAQPGKKMVENVPSGSDLPFRVSQSARSATNVEHTIAPMTTASKTAFLRKGDRANDSLKKTEDALQNPADLLPPLNSLLPLGLGSLLPSVNGLLAPVTNLLPPLPTIPSSLPSPMQLIPRMKPGPDKVIQQYGGEVGWDHWWGSYDRNSKAREIGGGGGGRRGGVQGKAGLRDGVVNFATNWRDMMMQAFASGKDDELAVGVRKDKYGVYVDRQNSNHATSFEVLSRYSGFGGMVDFSDRDYGGRVKIRDFDALIRHDFDEFINPDPGEFATQLMFSWRDYAAAISTDIGDALYAVTVAIKRVQISLMRDFDERRTEATIDGRKGWHAEMKTKFLDPNSDEVYTKLGFGRKGLLYVAGGAGLTESGLPKADASVELPDSKFSLSLSESGGSSIAEYTVNIGRFRWTGDTVINAKRLMLPNLLGMLPQDVESLLVGRRIRF